jgi:hypothetical protein
VIGVWGPSLVQQLLWLKNGAKTWKDRSNFLACFPCGTLDICWQTITNNRTLYSKRHIDYNSLGACLYIECI